MYFQNTFNFELEQPDEDYFDLEMNDEDFEEDEAEFDDGGGFGFDHPSRDEEEGDDGPEEESEEGFAEDEDEGSDFVKGREIGIDLGTTNSVVSYVGKNGAVQVIKVKGSPLIASCIFFKNRDDVYYGKKAKDYAKAIKRGCAVSQFKKHLRADSEKIPVRIPVDECAGDGERKYYILDTNVFIDQPDVLKSFPPNAVIILPITVEQELEYRAGDINTKYSAEAALKAITDFKEKSRENIIFAKADLSLLGEDFFKPEAGNNTNNDNKILSIAVQYKAQNVTLISSDRELVKLKAEQVGVKGLTLREFNLQREDSPQFDEFELTGTEASAMFLGYLKQEAEKALGEPVSKAVITVPATFNIVEIENTKRAGSQAGFSKIHIEKEPTAAAIAYSIDARKQETTFIYDFGGGTFDVSIIRSDGNGNFNVLATAGNSKLGGEDLTRKLEEFVYEYLEDNYDLQMYSEDESGLSAEHFAYNVERIYWGAEACKIELSAMERTTMTLMDIYIRDDEQKSVLIDISQEQFEALIKPIINLAVREMDNGLSKADMKTFDVDNVILAGGTSLIPCIQTQVERYFGRKPSADKNAATLIAEGAAIIANGLFGNNHLIKMRPQVFDMTYEDFGVALEKWDYSCIIPAGTKLPAVTEKRYSLVEDGQSQLNLKVFSRKSEAQNARKTFDEGIEYLDELIMTQIPPMRIDEVDVVVRFEITKQYELRTDVTLIKKDGTVVDKGNLSIDRQSTR